jgi:hypothetical protein
MSSGYFVLFWCRQEGGEELSAFYGRGSWVGEETGIGWRRADKEFRRVVICIGPTEARAKGGVGSADIGGGGFCGGGVIENE